jgi:hypothetical protein
VSEFLTLTDDDDGKLFRVRVLNTGEERIARYHCFSLDGMSVVLTGWSALTLARMS